MTFYDLDPTPPQGTKYKWIEFRLTAGGRAYRACLTSKALGRYTVLGCERDEKGFFGYLTFYPFSGKPIVYGRRTRRYQTALSACRAIERTVNALLKRDTKPWMKQAMKLGWRPPYQGA